MEESLRSMAFRINLDCPIDFMLKFDEYFPCSDHCRDMRITLNEVAAIFKRQNTLTKRIRRILGDQSQISLSKSVQSKTWLSNCHVGTPLTKGCDPLSTVLFVCRDHWWWSRFVKMARLYQFGGVFF